MERIEPVHVTCFYISNIIEMSNECQAAIELVFIAGDLPVLLEETLPLWLLRFSRCDYQDWDAC